MDKKMHLVVIGFFLVVALILMNLRALENGDIMRKIGQAVFFATIIYGLFAYKEQVKSFLSGI